MRTGRAIVVSLLAGWLLAGPARPAAAQWITFSSPLVDEHGNQPASVGRTVPVRGYLSVPVESGRYPGVVLLTSCDGRRPYHQTWAQALAERGYVALLVDDYFMHDHTQTCGISDAAAAADLLRLRLRHALSAARYLSAHPKVDSERIAVMGWGDAPIRELIGDTAELGPRHDVFTAAIAMTPASCLEREHSSSRALLVLRAGSASGDSPGRCAAPDGTPALEVRTYEGTRPGFDNPQAARTRGSAADEGARYDRLAHARAIDDVAAFLARRLAPASAQSVRASAEPSPADAVRGTWAIDPNTPGADLPPVGGSAFDAVFSRATADGAVYDVPFPFTRLLDALERAAGGGAMTSSQLDGTLIPLGRSLQREAAAPDYFQSPRIVVAVTGRPDVGAGPLGIPLDNRLFIGYQPSANVVEVISYNEAAARFEFQVVRDYGADLEPRVGYARRALCMSCHQNAAPIFSDASWDETTANTDVVRRLAPLGVRFHGIPVIDADRAVTAIDIASDEGNLLPVYQRLWSEGCASARASEVARCRAGALLAMLQSRLSGGAGFERASPLHADGFLAVQRRNWRERWPDGLLIPSANLPNRAPLLSPTPTAVPAALDPLRPRPPLARWQASSERDLDALVRGLARSLPHRHIALLDRHLRAADKGGPGRVLTSPCEIMRRGFAGRPRLLQIECGSRSPSDTEFYLRAQLRVTPQGDADGEAAWLGLGAGSYSRRALSGRVEPDGRLIALELARTDGETSLRAPDGNTIEGLGIAWEGELEESATRFAATGSLYLADDFRPVAAALGRLAADDSADNVLLAERFDGIALADRLLAELGVSSVPRLADARPLPLPRLDFDAGATDTVLSSALEHGGPLGTFRRYCGACHGDDTTFPPGFLHGDGDAVVASVAHCAERIYYRLSMWHLASDEQLVPPMPPAQGLSLAGTNAAQWRRGESLERLIDYARARLIEAGLDPRAVLDGDYRAARACLARRDE